jgi:hypothetical protein
VRMRRETYVQFNQHDPSPFTKIMRSNVHVCHRTCDRLGLCRLKR